MHYRSEMEVRQCVDHRQRRIGRKWLRAAEAQIGGKQLGG
jgi:hypothetical protein